MNMIGKRQWIYLGVALGALLFLAGCELPWDPDEIEIIGGSTYPSPTEAGIIDAGKGMKFLFYSTVTGSYGWARFQVPSTGDYNIFHGGQPVFDVWIRTSQYGTPLAAPAHDETVTITLNAGTNYYVEVDQPGAAMMGASSLWIWAD
jgi:hypothetical protein